MAIWENFLGYKYPIIYFPSWDLALNIKPNILDHQVLSNNFGSVSCRLLNDSLFSTIKFAESVP